MAVAYNVTQKEVVSIWRYGCAKLRCWRQIEMKRTRNMFHDERLLSACYLFVCKAHLVLSRGAMDGEARIHLIVGGCFQ